MNMEILAKTGSMDAVNYKTNKSCLEEAREKLKEELTSGELLK
jgi:hypothetical protein